MPTPRSPTSWPRILHRTPKHAARFGFAGGLPKDLHGFNIRADERGADEAAGTLRAADADADAVTARVSSTSFAEGSHQPAWQADHRLAEIIRSFSNEVP
ncbi:hypothetical protein [Streptomyces sp. NP-1717]|uniref:hypothetical protein n=1 Tax=Streptomyces sp. NP-1717 TaxID=2704470 RepID=UPI001F5D1454|nr:hypothetical protein [Streptomyces sp. NP-1717]MCI3226036.1 hypothetical protein [Streptomyces sp. NP-1717]